MADLLCRLAVFRRFVECEKSGPSTEPTVNSTNYGEFKKVKYTLKHESSMLTEKIDLFFPH